MLLLDESICAAMTDGTDAKPFYFPMYPRMMASAKDSSIHIIVPYWPYFDRRAAKLLYVTYLGWCPEKGKLHGRMLKKVFRGFKTSSDQAGRRKTMLPMCALAPEGSALPKSRGYQCAGSKRF